ncbi:MAG TPA: YihY/virulence factor BrkB family protein [Thermoanaerobaculia bacterium]|nr:YihY/virulence factor BrkB family protein [Thermoanaerobaculia bacterium]
MKRPRLVTAIRLTFAAFREHNASRFGAALAFYIVFTIAPTLLIAIGIAGSLFGRPEAEQAVIDRIAGSFGSATANAIEAMIRSAASPRRSGWLATTIGVATLLFGLGGVYRQIDDALRAIWGAKHPRDGGVRAIEKRLASMLFVIGAGAVVLLSVIADAAIAMTGKLAATRLEGGEWLWHAAQLLVSTLVLTALFAAVFRYLAQVPVTWRDVSLGAAVTAVLFVVGKFALGIYLGKAAVGSAYGAAGSVVVVLLWSYWSAQIFFFGLELTHVYATERGTRA